jgi:transposase InsO family protein
VESILQRAREKQPSARHRIISDNGPQFVARDFKQFIRVAGMTHARTSPYYPQSNGKAAKLAVKEQAICADRDRKLLLARERRRLNRNNRTQPHLLTTQPQISI